ncbi:hypothetical protein EJ04DRAFT_446679 [Polyplosphaeria fusca]|uniref:Uncharacterized protein n=1 Tax=Polyplosphaeria fusca TaxID=682080 RepID=A0A9P4UV89_9PLEO|nr:hypothetical protein EJ04DRAFT_446679 [Polyplosphaeria fusca]
MFVSGETSTSRTIYTVVSLFCAVLLSILLGFRAKTLRNNVLRKTNLTSILICVLFFFALSFIFSAAVVESGLGLPTHAVCYGAAIICLVFYTGNKLTIYIFLLERARVVRAPFVSRLRDWIWVGGMIVICCGFGTIAIVGYMSPIVELSRLDGRCRIGLPPKVSFPLLSFDVGVNFALTAVFFFLLRPIVSFDGKTTRTRMFDFRFPRSIRSRQTLDDEDTGSHTSVVNANIKILLWKSLWGSLAIMLPTVGNMAQFYVMKGRELGWICLTVCTLDVSWGVIVINWLTTGSAEAEENLTKSVKAELDSAARTYSMSSTRPRALPRMEQPRRAWHAPTEPDKAYSEAEFEKQPSGAIHSVNTSNWRSALRLLNENE